MKSIVIKNILIVCLFIVFTSVSYSCKDSNKTKIEKVDKNGKEFTSKYICPMHCKGSGSEIAGTCPVCEMDYEINEKYKEEK
jgi:predicted nucleic acid binding AN1-type Zn finger protein